ncbi:MAG TPA: hypothetical protein DCW68_02620 [Rhodospirillaceae bacterium]|nr:MAG: hypothetical protein A2018_05595 [Alphaproteobacteria bacterium GWF2_58_20]HAU28988.1 hypothetical protein [Rhodospirillaceae bacterium]
MIDLFKPGAQLDDLLAAGIPAYVDAESGELVAADGHGYGITGWEDGWFLRLLSPTDARVAALRGLGWVDAPRQVWA